MTLGRRLLVRLDVKGGRVMKGVRFETPRDIGDPAELAERYESGGADEIVLVDISASPEERAMLRDVARRTAERLFIPLTLGGGIRGVGDIGRALRAGADKVSINSAAVERPEVLDKAAERFGSQCVVASIDAKRDGDAWRVYVRSGRVLTALDAVAWAVDCARHGAGQILLTSLDRDGGRSGYDLELTRAVADAVDIPVIASGGAGSADHVYEALREGRADAALVAGILHDGVTTVTDIKRALAGHGLRVRAAA